jgi:hypothetical protein
MVSTVVVAVCASAVLETAIRAKRAAELREK